MNFLNLSNEQIKKIVLKSVSPEEKNVTCNSWKK